MNIAIPTKPVNVTATLRIVSTIKGKPLIPVETFHHVAQIDDDYDFSDVIITAVCDAQTREAFVDAFRDRLRKNSKLKNEIGGTRWSVDILSISFER